MNAQVVGAPQTSSSAYDHGRVRSASKGTLSALRSPVARVVIGPFACGARGVSGGAPIGKNGVDAHRRLLGVDARLRLPLA